MQGKVRATVAQAYAAGLTTVATQDVVLPKEHCDDRVEIMQADARTLDTHELYAKFEVMLYHGCAGKDSLLSVIPVIQVATICWLGDLVAFVLTMVGPVKCVCA